MPEQEAAPPPEGKTIYRNLWAVSLTSFLTDISSEMVINVVPLFLANVTGASPVVIGLIEGAAEALASTLKMFSGWLSDRLAARKWLAVTGYAVSALAKPLFYFASSWPAIAAARWGDRAGKGIRTAPRDALIADSAAGGRRGLAFGFHRAADTAGAVLGLLVALLIVRASQASAVTLSQDTFQTLVLASLLPAFLGVLVLALMAKDVSRSSAAGAKNLFRGRDLGRPFLIFLAIVVLFDLGNSADAFLILRAQERGLSVSGILAMLITFNVVYAVLATPAGTLSDRLGRRRILIGGWLLYALLYAGFALADAAWQIWVLYACYGAYYGLSYGTAKAMVADLVPLATRGTAYGAYNGVLGLVDLPASILAGWLWQRYGPPAPFVFGAVMALMATAALLAWKRPASESS